MKQNLLITLAITGMLCLAGQLFTIAAHPGSTTRTHSPQKQFRGVRRRLLLPRGRNSL